MSKKRPNHFMHWLTILAVLLGSVLTVQYTSNLSISVLDTPEHAPFDGTVYPVQYVPDWTYTDYDMQQNDYSYFSSQGMLVSIPEYDPSTLLEPTADLVWGTDEYIEIVNAQITYPVVYAGTYALDGEEYAGSHPAIDIKAPEGTPVYAIANGIAQDVTYSSSGFGNNIVLAHYDVPSLENENLKTDLFSSYSHLSEILIAEGDVVEKGQMIGKVGDTGTATTNHLHFQVDNEDAPWSPYWPFTYSEYTSAGYSFFDAVNNALGADNVLEYTIHPFNYIHEYQDYDFEAEEEVVETNDDGNYTYTYEAADSEEQGAEEVEEETEIVVTDPEGGSDDYVIRDFDDIQVVADSYVLLDNNLSLYLYLNDVYGSRVSDPEFTGSIQMTLSDDSVGDLNITHLEKEDFDNGYYTLIFSPIEAGETTLTFALDEFEKEFDIAVLSELNYVNGFSVEHDGSFTIGSPETITIKAIDEDGNFTPSYNVNGNVDFSLISGGGTFDPKNINKTDFDSGVAEVIFTPTSAEDAVIKARNGAITGMSTVIRNTLFSDLDDSYQYYKAVKYLREDEVINGYPDGTFQPENEVSRVEALKMLFEAFDTELSDGSNLTFPDVETDQWYADYVATAKVLEIIDGYPDGTFRPADPVNKVEFMKMLLNAAGEKADPVVIGDPYDDVDNLTWYAPYANTAKQFNLVPVNGDYFEPSHYMTRVEVAETIYRWLAIQYNEADEYSVLLSLS